MTPRDRERSYLAGLLTQRDPAKEVRAFGLAGFLRVRLDRLYDERIAEMRRISARQRLAFAGQSAGMMQESAMFIDDFLAFTEQAAPE